MSKMNLFLIISFILIQSTFSDQLIIYEEIDNIAIIKFNRTHHLNALNTTVFDHLLNAINALDTTKISALIITGAGEKAFVAGADIYEMSTLSKRFGQELSRRGNEVFRKIEMLPIPVLAVVNGYALGGGVELALSCDIRICSTNAIFGMPEVKLGINPGFGGTQRLARLIGQGMAKQMIYGGSYIDAYEALRIGLVNSVFPQGEGVLRAQRDKINRVRTFKSFEPFRGKNPSTTFRSEIKKTRFHSQKTHFQIRKNTFLQSGYSTQRAQKTRFHSHNSIWKGNL